MTPLPLSPSDSLTTGDVRRGLRMLLLDGVCTQVMLVLTGGAFLVAFALHLGASNKLIGVIAAMGPMAQILQLPGIYLVERVRRRKLLVVAGAALGRVFLIVMALTPWLLPESRRLPVFVLALFLFWGVGAVGGAAFTPWMRDLVPHRILGRYFGRRLAVAVTVGAAASLVAGRAVDVYGASHGSIAPAYAALFVAGAAVGFAGVGFLSRIPEPRMAPPPERSVWAVVAEPFRDEAFRRVMGFFGWWSFAANFAAPFFAVYLLQRLGLSLTWIMALFLVSQAAHVAFLRVWGHLADRLTQKAVLAAAGPLFLLSTALWPLTTLPGPAALTLLLLALIHALAGISTGGMALCGWNMLIKLAPKDRAASYLASNALVSGVAATASPIIAGVTADHLTASGAHLALGVPGGTTLIDLGPLDLVFVVSIVAGVFALQRLRFVVERGQSPAGVSLADVQAEIRAAMRSVSNVAGLRLLSNFPYGIIRRSRARDGKDGPDAG